MDVIRTYFEIGLRHIVPEGVDHILFVLGLFLGSTTLRTLVLQITSFTVAHASTLAVAAAGAISAPPAVVEPLIAASIAFVAFENVRSPRFHPSRLIVVFAFGLLHGLGFASALTSLGLPDGMFVPALLGFNLGVEAGQLLVVATALAIVGWARARPWYRDRVAVPLSWLIGMIGLYWTWTRVST